MAALTASAIHSARRQAGLFSAFEPPVWAEQWSLWQHPDKRSLLRNPGNGVSESLYAPCSNYRVKGWKALISTDDTAPIYRRPRQSHGNEDRDDPLLRTDWFASRAGTDLWQLPELRDGALLAARLHSARQGARILDRAGTRAPEPVRPEGSLLRAGRRDRQGALGRGRREDRLTEVA